ncbi:M15 family metallopeptidase [Umezawaea sp. NPDC059074]|uniref:M15 family metallopeptidase n=1 Tax=Umezawaea sp. NPDC059074 TaxID=3346716 RepID=UPI0036A99714
MTPKVLTAALGVVAVLLVTACTPEAAPSPSAPPSTEPSASDEDGVVPDGGVSVLAADHVAIHRLNLNLLTALRHADVDARRDGVELKVTSGWRSHKYQERLLDEAVVTYGSLAEARKHVNSVDRSTHVSGDAVDIGPTASDDWLIQHGAAYGLCQAYANEMWHFELLTSPGGQCPAPLTDASG